MRIQIHKDDCCGCTACASSCPKKAITMKPDPLGFLYPEINNDLCIDCGKCVRVCAFNENYKTPFKLDTIQAYAGKHRDVKEVAKSQSGGAFVVLSDYILSQGGVVYGVGYKDHFRVAHKRATTKMERDEFRGSKYVQSDMTGIFPLVKQDLENGLLVMFTGTPCQVAALASYIGTGRIRENLFLMDIVCHGVPGPFVWKEYLTYLEKKEGKKLTSVNFRDKSYKGWRSHVESFTFSYTYTYTYTYLFYSHINLRYSCGNCPFTNLNRVSDITVSDFWGIEKSRAASMGADNRGCSLFLVNTKKGASWFSMANKDLEFMPVSIDECMQPQLRHPSKLHPQRAQFEKDFSEKGFAYVRRKYGDVGFRYWTKTTKKKLIKLVYPALKPIMSLIRKNKYSRT